MVSIFRAEHNADKEFSGRDRMPLSNNNKKKRAVLNTEASDEMVMCAIQTSDGSWSLLNIEISEHSGAKIILESRTSIHYEILHSGNNNLSYTYPYLFSGYGITVWPVEGRNNVLARTYCCSTIYGNPRHPMLLI